MRVAAWALVVLALVPRARGLRLAPSMKQKHTAYRLIADNRMARRNYEILETVEAGVSLVGTEVKSVRNGKVNLRDGFASLEDGEIFLKNVHIAEHGETGQFFNHEPKRARRLLLHKKEIRKFRQKLMEKGLTLVPLRMYFNERSWLKVQLGLAKGKKLYDKRDALRKRDLGRELSRATKGSIRGE